MDNDRSSANQLLRQLGLIFFLAAVGTDAGAEIVQTFENTEIQLFLFGGIITFSDDVGSFCRKMAF